MISSPVSVLVLGVGSHVSQGIVKALAMSTLKTRVIGTCISAKSEFLYFVDRAVVQPRIEAGEKGYVEWLIKVCRDERIDIIMTGIEPVIRLLATHANEIRSVTGAITVAASGDILDIAQDKLATCRWLEKNGFGFPPYHTWSNHESWRAFTGLVGFPIIAKPLHGGGSRGLHILRKESDIALVAIPQTYVFQKHVGSPDAEYTVGCFRSPNTGETDAIVMRRDLSQGFTYKAEIVEHPEIADESIRIVRALGITGPCNLQLRLHDGKPCCFEINARFSGTTPIRAHFGFNDVEMTIRHFLRDETARLPKITRGIAFRYWNEAYIQPDARAAFAANGSLTPSDFPPSETDAFGMK